MISHVTLGVSDIDDAMTFYRQFMEVVGWEEKFATRRVPPGPWAGFRPIGAARPLLIIAHPDCPNTPAPAPGAGAMPVFQLATRAALDAVHAEALALGAAEVQPPAPAYPAPDYAAAVRDPFGNLLGLVCHAAEDAPVEAG